MFVCLFVCACCAVRVRVLCARTVMVCSLSMLACVRICSYVCLLCVCACLCVCVCACVCVYACVCLFVCSVMCCAHVWLRLLAPAVAVRAAHHHVAVQRRLVLSDIRSGEQREKDIRLRVGRLRKSSQARVRQSGSQSVSQSGAQFSSAQLSSAQLSSSVVSLLHLTCECARLICGVVWCDLAGGGVADRIRFRQSKGSPSGRKCLAGRAALCIYLLCILYTYIIHKYIHVYIIDLFFICVRTRVYRNVRMYVCVLVC